MGNGTCVISSKRYYTEALVWLFSPWLAAGHHSPIPPPESHDPASKKKITRMGSELRVSFKDIKADNIGV